MRNGRGEADLGAQRRITGTNVFRWLSVHSTIGVMPPVFAGELRRN